MNNHAGSTLLDLYHRTSAAAAAAILRNHSMVSKENTAEAFFSTHRDTQITDYGEAVVHIRVPAAWIDSGWVRLDDEFELDDDEFESHYAVEVSRLRPEHFIRD